MRTLHLSDQAFRALAHRLADFSADYLAELPSLPSYPPGLTGRRTEFDSLHSDPRFQALLNRI